MQSGLESVLHWSESQDLEKIIHRGQEREQKENARITKMLDSLQHDRTETLSDIYAALGIIEPKKTQLQAVNLQ